MGFPSTLTSYIDEVGTGRKNRKMENKVPSFNILNSTYNVGKTRFYIWLNMFHIELILIALRILFHLIRNSTSLETRNWQGKWYSYITLQIKLGLNQAMTEVALVQSEFSKSCSVLLTHKHDWLLSNPDWAHNPLCWELSNYFILYQLVNICHQYGISESEVLLLDVCTDLLSVIVVSDTTK